MKASVKHLSEDTFSKEIAQGITLVDFYAEWCGPCRMMAPILEELANELASKAKIAKIDIDDEQGIAAQFQISSVPTLILFKDGKEVNRLVGLRNAQAIKDFILSTN